MKVWTGTEGPDGRPGLDNGPKAIGGIKGALVDYKMTVGNGPTGAFESDQFSKGTYDMAECIAELTEKNKVISIISITDGDDSVAEVNGSDLAPKMSHVFTGGQRQATEASKVSLRAERSVEDPGEADLKGKAARIRSDLNVPLHADPRDYRRDVYRCLETYRRVLVRQRCQGVGVSPQGALQG